MATWPAALRLVLAIFLQSSRTLVDAAAYEQERTWETGSRPAATVDAESARGSAPRAANVSH